MFWDSASIFGALTPKFYVALTGTSSLISGLILIFEWWYFRKYGTSFIEQVSLSHLGPWLGGGAGASGAEAAEGAGAGGALPAECKVWRNPMSLLRGAEYGRLWSLARRAPLTYYDMNLSAQEHQAWFGGGEGSVADWGGGGSEAVAEAHMARAWREREPGARVAAARAALAARPDCAAALLLLAEEEAPTVQEAERVLRRAWRAGEAAWRAGGAGAGGGEAARRAGAVLAHVKRRAAMCARRLGRLRDAARMFRELSRDAPPALAALPTHENLIEVLLEQRLYADVQGVVARAEAELGGLGAGALFTGALLRARHAAAAPPPLRAPAEAAALEAMRRAMEYNPYVSAFLLERRALALPPEHVVRRGESEALAYAFWHLRHWRHVDGALALLAAAERAQQAAGAGGAGGAGGGGRGGRGRCGACARCGDRELLSPRPRGPRMARAPLLAAACALCALLALLAHRCPQLQPDALARLLTAL